MAWQGTWNAGTLYAVNDTVGYAGTVWICQSGNSGQVPTPGAYWAAQTVVYAPSSVVDNVVVTGTPTTGQVITATSGTAANWQTAPGGGSGTVTSVAATDTSIVVSGTPTVTPTIATGTLDVIATQHPPAAAWSNNSKKITSVANGSGAQDAAAFGQIPLIDSTASDIQAVGVQAAGSTGKAADAGHVHALGAPLYNYLAPSGATAETFPRFFAGAVAYTAPVSGTLYVRAIALPAGLTVNNITFIVGNTNEATGSHGWYVLLDSNRVVRAVTTDQTGAAVWTGQPTAPITVATNAYTTPAAGLYYVGVCIVAGTMPSFECGASTDSNIVGSKISPILAGTSSTGQTTPPSTGTTMGALTASGSFNAYAYTS